MLKKCKRSVCCSVASIFVLLCSQMAFANGSNGKTSSSSTRKSSSPSSSASTTTHTSTTSRSSGSSGQSSGQSSSTTKSSSGGESASYTYNVRLPRVWLLLIWINKYLSIWEIFVNILKYKKIAFLKAIFCFVCVWFLCKFYNC